MPRFKLFVQKNCKTSKCLGLRFWISVLPAVGSVDPKPPNTVPPITDFWLRATLSQHPIYKNLLWNNTRWQVTPKAIELKRKILLNRLQRVLWVGVVRQTQRAWFICTNKRTNGKYASTVNPGPNFAET